MKNFDRGDKLSVMAALGWLELENHLEANAELDKIAAELRAHPIVLRVRWCVYAQAEKWEPALSLARALQQVRPNDACGWALEAETFDLMGNTQLAWETLLPKAVEFPSEPIIGYLLACYASKLDYPLAAEQWLKRAVSLKDSRDFKWQVLHEPDLSSLWKSEPVRYKSKKKQEPTHDG